MKKRPRRLRPKLKRRNKFEDRIDQQLLLANVQYEYETERIPYILARNYIPDFIVQTKTKKIYIETKGYLRPEDKSKLKAVKKLHPDIDLRLVFYEYKLQSIRWATKNKIPYAIGSVPIEWLEE